MFVLINLVIFLLVSTSSSDSEDSPARCSNAKTCFTCTFGNNLRLDGRCYWCHADRKCHYGADDAPLPSWCTKTNTHTSVASECFAPAVYDPALAYKMLFLSALSYAHDATSLISNATEVNTFHVVKQVTTSCPGEIGKCSGFVAVSDTERAIAISFRGSQHAGQVSYEAFSVLIDDRTSFPAGGKVQQYFKKAFNTLWGYLKPDLHREMRNRSSSYEIWVTGHSLGGAIASLASIKIAYDDIKPRRNVILYTFGQPRVGDFYYALAHHRFVPNSFRVTHFHDPVVHLPFCRESLDEWLSKSTCNTKGPYHHGKEIYYDARRMTRRSPYIVCNGSPGNEDASCSNKHRSWVYSSSDAITDHKRYFEVNVGTWWKGENNCQSMISSNRAYMLYIQFSLVHIMHQYTSVFL